MSINYSALLNMIVSPCNEKFGCPNALAGVNREECELGCLRLEAFNKFLDSHHFDGYCFHLLGLAGGKDTTEDLTLPSSIVSSNNNIRNDWVTTSSTVN